MDLIAEEFVDRLLTKEASKQPCDNVRPDELVMELPHDFDEKKFNRGREFFSEHRYSLSSTMMLGLVAVFSVPSILQVLIGSRHSSSVYTAYKRYLSTLLHTVSWFDYELKPGTLSWRSLYTVRSRHLRASQASKLKDIAVISQRDLALTQFGFFGFCMLKPDNFGVRQLRDGDWDAYNYFWRVIGYMIGLEDRYNICRSTFYETREVCQVLQDRVFTPALENVPEHFEHMVMLDGIQFINPTVETDGFLYLCRYLADVPGYIYTEDDRMRLQNRLSKHLKGKSLDTGVDVSYLMRPAAVDGLPKRPPRLLYYKDYETIEEAPAYKQLKLRARHKLFIFHLTMCINSTYRGRLLMNFIFTLKLLVMKYFPYTAFSKLGFKKSFVNIFEEDPSDDTKPRLNEEYHITNEFF